MLQFKKIKQKGKLNDEKYYKRERNYRKNLNFKIK